MYHYQSKPILLVLLDLSTAFDAVDHNVFFFQLEDMFGLSGIALERFQPDSVSYFIGCRMFTTRRFNS